MVSNSNNTQSDGVSEDKDFSGRYDTATAKRSDFSKQAADESYPYAK